MRNGPTAFNSDGSMLPAFSGSWGSFKMATASKPKIKSNYRDLEVSGAILLIPETNPNQVGLKLMTTVQLTMLDSEWNTKLMELCSPHFKQFKHEYSKYMDTDNRTVEDYDWYDGEFYHTGLDEIILNFVKKGREEGSILITTDPNPEVKFSRLTDDKVTIIPACNDVFIGRLKAAYN